MINSTMELGKQALLRLDAEARLQQGSAPPNQGWTLSSNALATLFRLASDPDSAAEGLRLLHELQTHQVELDLQHEQLIANEREFAQELAHYKALYEFAPIGFLIVDDEGRVVESNGAGANLLGTVREEVTGRLFDSFFTIENRSELNNMLKKLKKEGVSSSCLATSATGRKSIARLLKLCASILPGEDVFLVIVSAYD